MSFLDKLKVKIEESEAPEQADKVKKDKKTAGFLQLDVDIFETSSDIIIIARAIPGWIDYESDQYFTAVDGVEMAANGLYRGPWRLGENPIAIP